MSLDSSQLSMIAVAPVDPIGSLILVGVAVLVLCVTVASIVVARRLAERDRARRGQLRQRGVRRLLLYDLEVCDQLRQRRHGHGRLVLQRQGGDSRAAWPPSQRWIRQLTIGAGACSPPL